MWTRYVIQPRKCHNTEGIKTINCDWSGVTFLIANLLNMMINDQHDYILKFHEQKAWWVWLISLYLWPYYHGSWEAHSGHINSGVTSTNDFRGHGGRLVTLSPPTSEAGVWFPALPQVGKLVVACHWSAVYSTEPWQTVCTGFLCPSNYLSWYDLYSVESDVKPQINK